MDTWILRMVRKRCIRRVIAWALATGCIVLVTFAAQRYLTNFILGPFELGQSELDSIRDISDAPHYFARVTGSKAIDTGIQDITIHERDGAETSRSVSGGFYALVVGDKFLIFKSAAGPATTVEGELSAIPPYLERALFNTSDMQSIRHRFYPVYLSDASFRLPGYFFIAGLLVFAFLLFGYGLPAWRHLQDPSSHPAVRRVASWGEPIDLAAEVEREARSPRYQGGGWLVTDKYLVQSRFFTFDVLRFCDLLWSYQRVTRHSINFIPTGKTHEIVLVCNGGAAEVKANEWMVEEILAFVADRAPWAVFGFSKEIEKLFNENTQGFCAAVEQRRRDWTQKVHS